MKRNFYMPAEWVDHERTIIEWPIKDSLCFPENHIEVLESYGEVVKAISKFEPVTLVVTKETSQEALKYTDGLGHYVEIPHNDAWSRDNGPTFLVNDSGNILGVNWRFNAWGEKYTPYDLDDAMAKELLKELNVEAKDVSIVLEGGSIHVDGQGTLLSTKECLLNKNRNPHLSQEDIESILKKELDISKFIWLNNGLFGDETDGHIDNIACFVAPGTILIQTCYDKEDPNYSITVENLEILNQARDAKGRKIQIVEMPTPPVRYYEGERLTLSYMNFYFVNKGIILPVFGGDAKETDEKAAQILQELFPDREIVSLPSIGIIKEGGNVHCITQQMPLVESRK